MRPSDARFPATIIVPFFKVKRNTLIVYPSLLDYVLFPNLHFRDLSYMQKKKKTSTTTMEISSLSTSRTMKTCLVNEGKGNQNINKYTFVQFLKCSSTTLCLSGSNPMGNLTIVWLMAMANFTLRIPFSLVSPLLQVQCFMVSLGYLRTLMKAPNFPCSS